MNIIEWHHLIQLNDNRVNAEMARLLNIIILSALIITADGEWIRTPKCLFDSLQKQLQPLLRKFQYIILCEFDGLIFLFENILALQKNTTNQKPSY